MTSVKRNKAARTKLLRRASVHLIYNNSLLFCKYTGSEDDSAPDNAGYCSDGGPRPGWRSKVYTLPEGPVGNRMGSTPPPSATASCGRISPVRHAPNDGRPLHLVAVSRQG